MIVVGIKTDIFPPVTLNVEMDKLMMTEWWPKRTWQFLSGTGPENRSLFDVCSVSPVDGVVLMLPWIPEYKRWWWAIVLGAPSTYFLAWWPLQRLSNKPPTLLLLGTAVHTTDELLEGQETVFFCQTTFWWQSSKLLWNQEVVFKGQCTTIQCRKNGQ